MNAEEISEKMKHLTGKKILLLGYGREGKTTHRFLNQFAKPALIGVADKNKPEIITEGTDASPVFFGEEYLRHISDFDIVIKSPGIPSHLPELVAARQQGAVFSSATELFFMLGCTIIGVTGTKGKSTTSSLIFEIVHRHHQHTLLVGNIGRPALEHVSELHDDTIAVFELSSFQLEDLHCSPHVAVLLNIVPEHLDNHGTYEAYQKAKLNILNFQSPEDFAVVSPDSSHYEVSRGSGHAARCLYAAHPGSDLVCWIENGVFRVRDHGEEVMLITRDQLPLYGPGNVLNALAAIAAAKAVDVPNDIICSALKEFKSLPHRLEFIETVRGITFFNDSLSTIPQAALNALEGLGESVQTMILGGYDRGVDVVPLAQGLIPHLHHLKTILLFPTTGEKIWEALVAIVPEGTELPKKFDVKTMEEAVSRAFQETEPGKICLLSPAASSFSLFRDYQDRGDSFRRVVLEWENKK